MLFRALKYMHRIEDLQLKYSKPRSITILWASLVKKVIRRFERVQHDDLLAQDLQIHDIACQCVLLSK